MAEVFDCCGGRGRHLPGCDFGGGKKKKKLPKKGDIVKGHVHDYTVARVWSHKTDTEVIQYVQSECLEKGCPEPVKVEIQSRRKRRRGE